MADDNSLEARVEMLEAALAAHMEVRKEIVRLVGWIDLETAENYQPERRVVVRAAFPRRVARALLADLRRVLARGGH